MQIKIGADPELFIVNKDSGKLISAHTLIPGTKENPHPVTHGAIQVDGMAAEFNINPATTAAEFTANVLSVLYDLKNIIKERNPDLNFDFVFSPVAEFGKEYIDSMPEETRQLGCNPDYNAWLDGKANPTPNAEMPFRTASGHIHVGWGEDIDISDPDHIEACCMMAKAMDINVLPNNIQLEEKYYPNTGKKRRDLYGKAGAFRPKSYGVEYRSTSNVWLLHTSFIHNVFQNTLNTFQNLMGGYRNYEDKVILSYISQDVLNNSNLEKINQWAIIPNIYTYYKKIGVDTIDEIFQKYVKVNDLTKKYDVSNIVIGVNPDLRGKKGNKVVLDIEANAFANALDNDVVGRGDHVADAAQLLGNRADVVLVDELEDDFEDDFEEDILERG